MTAQPRIQDLVQQACNVNEMQPLAALDPAGDTHVQAVLSAAILCSVAFRMRDENGLIETLRTLTEAVAAFERQRG